MYLTNTFSVLILLRIVAYVSGVNIRLVVRRYDGMLHRQIKSEGILEVIHHTLNISIGAQLTDLVFGIRFFDKLKIAA